MAMNALMQGIAFADSIGRRRASKQASAALLANDPYAAEQAYLAANLPEQALEVRAGVAEHTAAQEALRKKERAESMAQVKAQVATLRAAGRERGPQAVVQTFRANRPLYERLGSDRETLDTMEQALTRGDPMAVLDAIEREAVKYDYMQSGDEQILTRQRGENAPEVVGRVRGSKTHMNDAGVFQSPYWSSDMPAEAAPVAVPEAAVPPPPSGPVSFSSPLPGGRVTDTFGSRGGAHNGDDIAKPAGTPVLAAGDGEVLDAGWDPKGGGNFVRVRHLDGTVTSYSHLAEPAQLRRGQRIGRGSPIGRVGSTGNASGPHLHFRADAGGVPQNPRTLLGIERYIVSPEEVSGGVGLNDLGGGPGADALAAQPPGPQMVQRFGPKPSDTRADRNFEYGQQRDAVQDRRNAQADRRAEESLRLQREAAARAAKPPAVEGQRKAAGYLHRTLIANEQLNSLGKHGVFKPSTLEIVAGKNGVARLTIRSPQDRQFVTAAKNWLAPILRKDTGAAVSDQELITYADMYIPMPEDDMETMRLKAESRNGAMQALLGEAGGEYAKVPSFRKSFNVVYPKPNDRPRKGEVRDGYRYKGGDPANPKSWARTR